MIVRVLQIGMTPTWGGVESFITNYYNNIDRTRFKFDFVGVHGKDIVYSDKIRAFGGDIYILKEFKRHPFENAVQLRSILEQNQYDIVHVNMSSAAYSMPVFISCGCKKKPIVIAHSHNTNVPSGILRKIMNAVNIGKLRKMPVEKWACSVKAGEWLWGDAFDSSNVIPNAIDINRFQFKAEIRDNLRKSCGFQEQDQVIGFVGRLAEQKNVLFLPEILAELRQLSSAYKMLIVGDGNLRKELAKKFERLGLDGYVYFAGPCQNTAPWYSAMDAFVLPSLFEGLGIVGLEAQACAVPCFVSSRIPEELNITGTVRYLPIDQGAKIWADTIHTALLDESRQSYAFPQEYDIIYAAKQLEERYLLLLERKG